VVPGGRPLHDYTNLYINARNPMMFKRKEINAELCVLRVSPAVLDLDGVVVTDMNAARDIARFRPAATGLAFVDRELVFAEDWRHPGDRLAYERHQGIMCAEVLVPDRVDANFIFGAYVSCPESRAALNAMTLGFQWRSITCSSVDGGAGMVRTLIGDLFQSKAQTLVNTVNCVGVMGKGVALEFKRFLGHVRGLCKTVCRKKSKARRAVSLS
jgi:hypothetical protein